MHAPDRLKGSSVDTEIGTLSFWHTHVPTTVHPHEDERSMPSRCTPSPRLSHICARAYRHRPSSQVQFANLLLLNKTDLVTTEESQKVKKFLTLFNPRAKIVRTQHSAIDVTSLLEERQYDESEFSSMPAWAEELSKGAHS